MRLPGTRYQEHGWEQVRKLLGHCSLLAFRQGELHLLLDRAQEPALLDWYVDAVAAELRLTRHSVRAEAPGNSYGDSVCELALSLLFELQAQPAYWGGLLAAFASEHAKSGAFWQRPNGDAVLRKKVNDMYAGLRDKVDADNYQVTLGRACSPNKMYTYRMLDTAYREIEQVFANWRQHPQQVAAILGRQADGIPIEARQMKAIGGCQPEWVIRWSETLERFSGSVGPLHTKSKRFSSLKNSPQKIEAMMAEIGDYEALSANLDAAGDWRSDGEEAALWLDDYLRVIGESEVQEEEEPPVPDVVDQILQPPEADEEVEEFEQIAAPDGGDDDGYDGDAHDEDATATEASAIATATATASALTLTPLPVAAPPRARGEVASDEALAASLSLPLRYMELAAAAQPGGVLQAVSLPIRLAVYQKLLGAADDSYPDEWLDPATGELPTLQQLAALDRISMPTLRKRRNEAIDKLYAVKEKK